MTTPNLRRISKFLSLVLRHQPELVDLDVDPQGWVRIDQLITNTNARGKISLSRASIEETVASNDKQRFALSEDGTRIRANQGHSISIDLALEPVEPPAVLFHGTATRFLGLIHAQGLTKQNRQHVHLSADELTASAVGVRHGKLAMLRVDAAAMHDSGHEFFRSDNGVWLTDHVPPTYLSPVDA